MPGGAVIETVERDIRLALNIGTCAAGRTDAVSWIHSYIEFLSILILNHLHALLILIDSLG